MRTSASESGSYPWRERCLDATSTNALISVGVESLVPESPELAEPGVDTTQWRRFQFVVPSRTVDADAHESGLTENIQVLGHGRLRDPELRSRDRGDRARGRLAV